MKSSIFNSTSVAMPPNSPARLMSVSISKSSCIKFSISPSKALTVSDSYLILVLNCFNFCSEGINDSAKAASAFPTISVR